MKKGAFVRVLKTITAIMVCLIMTISVSSVVLASDIEVTIGSDQIYEGQEVVVPVCISNAGDIRYFDLEIVIGDGQSTALSVEDGMCDVESYIGYNGEYRVTWRGTGPLSEDGVLFFIRISDISVLIKDFEIDIIGTFMNTIGEEVVVPINSGQVYVDITWPAYITIVSGGMDIEMIAEQENELLINLLLDPHIYPPHILDGNLQAEDVKIYYDDDVMEYIGKGPEDSRLTFAGESEGLGIVRIMVIQQEDLSANTDLFNTIFYPIDQNKIYYTLIDFDCLLGLAPSGTTVESLSRRTLVTVMNRDQSLLNIKITEAQEKYDNAVVGSDPGEYPSNSKVDFGEVIRKADLLTHHIYATQADTDAKVAELEEAISTFDATRIKEIEQEDLNNDGIVNVGDLAIVAYYYNATSSDSDWDAASIADINGDGVVDVLDLASVATKAME